MYHCTGSRVGPKAVWTGVGRWKCLSSTVVRTLNRLARSESLYRLSYSGRVCNHRHYENVTKLVFVFNVHGSVHRNNILGYNIVLLVGMMY
jgi:hypothetical protein